jgi:hypothetical protein
MAAWVLPLLHSRLEDSLARLHLRFISLPRLLASFCSFKAARALSSGVAARGLILLSAMPARASPLSLRRVVALEVLVVATVICSVDMATGAEAVRTKFEETAPSELLGFRCARQGNSAAAATKRLADAASSVDGSGSAELHEERGEAGGEGDGGRDAGKEAALARRTITGAFTIDARFAYSNVLLESSK